MKASRRICSAFFYACTAGGAFAFMPHMRMTATAGMRPTPGDLQGCISSVASRGRSSFTGMAILPTRIVAGTNIGRSGGRRRDLRGRSMGMLFKDTLLGVGTPEVLVVLVVGYFVLGPVELFKFAKQAGILLGQLKDIGLGTANNLGQIMEEQVRQAELVASGLASPSVDRDSVYPETEEDEYEDILVDEFGRLVENSSAQRSSPILDEDEKPFWGSIKPESLGLEEGGEGPLKKATKFTEQLSGRINAKVMEDEQKASSMGGPGRSSYGWPAAEADWTGAAASTVGAGAGMGVTDGQGIGSDTEKTWTSDDIDVEAELANDVPAELSMEEQFERLEKIASLEEERALTMQKLEARIDAKMNMIKSELMDVVAEDFQAKRSRINRDFVAKGKAKAVAGGAQAVELTEQRLDGQGGEGAATAAQGGGDAIQGPQVAEITA